jgi:hypothetical protein
MGAARFRSLAEWAGLQIGRSTGQGRVSPPVVADLVATYADLVAT